MAFKNTVQSTNFLEQRIKNWPTYICFGAGSRTGYKKNGPFLEQGINFRAILFRNCNLKSRAGRATHTHPKNTQEPEKLKDGDVTDQRMRDNNNNNNKTTKLYFFIPKKAFVARS